MGVRHVQPLHLALGLWGDSAWVSAGQLEQLIGSQELAVTHALYGIGTLGHYSTNNVTQLRATSLPLHAQQSWGNSVTYLWKHTHVTRAHVAQH